MEDGIPMIDLFCGMGGLALGFAQNGFCITGYDINPRVPEIFQRNRIGQAIVAVLSKDILIESAPVLITGGPPCRPWSRLNIRRRGERHPDHHLMVSFFHIILDTGPEVFLMENVPLLASDPIFQDHLQQMRNAGYEVEYQTIRYSDFGAATSRCRLILVGFQGCSGRAHRFFQMLERFRKPPLSVREVLDPLLERTATEDPDHVWLSLRTIDRYQDKYRTARFGWYRLKPDAPAPSFGNIAKTYILHPYAGNGREIPLRVLSVREAMAIMGFPDWFRFPEGMGISPRYQMVADAVSPIFSLACGKVMQELMRTS